MTNIVKREIINICELMVAGNVNLIDGCRTLISLSHKLDSVDVLFNPIKAFDSETDHLPRGSMREQCSKEYLESADKEAEEYLRSASGEIIDACTEIKRAMSN